jgi:hypothetical protein
MAMLSSLFRIMNTATRYNLHTIHGRSMAFDARIHALLHFERISGYNMQIRQMLTNCEYFRISRS